MFAERYRYYVEKTKGLYPDLIEHYQNKFNKSSSKGEDFYLCCHFYSSFSETLFESEPYSNTCKDYEELFTDGDAMFPMPQSVMKQFVNMLFDMKHLNILYDVPIEQGIDEIDVRKYDKDELIAQGNEYFSEEEEEAEEWE